MQRTRAKSAGTRRHHQYEQRLSSILKAASRVIAREGFEGASVRAVAARAGIGLSGIYYYFTNKGELLYALQHHTFSTLVSTLKERLAKARTPEAQLRAVVLNHLEFFVRNMDELKVCVHEIESLSGKPYREILAIRKTYYALVHDVVAANTGKGKRHTDIATLFLFGALNWMYMWYDPKRNTDTRALANRFTRLLLDGIRSGSNRREAYV